MQTEKYSALTELTAAVKRNFGALAAADSGAVKEALSVAIAALNANACPSKRFTDAPPIGNWAHEGIDYCLTNDLIARPCSRQMAL